MEITRAGSKPSGKGPADWFTGTVRIDPLFTAPAPARVGGAPVTFEPGARTAWHTHPLGQTLIVTSGVGWVQREGRSRRGNPPWGRGLVSARREALARRDGHDSCRAELLISRPVHWGSGAPITSSSTTVTAACLSRGSSCSAA